MQNGYISKISDMGVTQKIIIPKTTFLKNIEVKFGTYNRNNEGKIDIKVYNNDEEIFNGYVDKKSILNDDFNNICSINKLIKSGDVLKITMTSSNDDNNSVAVYYSTDCNIGELSFDNIKKENTCLTMKMTSKPINYYDSFAHILNDYINERKKINISKNNVEIKQEDNKTIYRFKAGITGDIKEINIKGNILNNIEVYKKGRKYSHFIGKGGDIYRVKGLSIPVSNNDFIDIIVDNNEDILENDISFSYTDRPSFSYASNIFKKIYHKSSIYNDEFENIDMFIPLESGENSLSQTYTINKNTTIRAIEIPTKDIDNYKVLITHNQKEIKNIDFNREKIYIDLDNLSVKNGDVININIKKHSGNIYNSLYFIEKAPFLDNIFTDIASPLNDKNAEVLINFILDIDNEKISNKANRMLKTILIFLILFISANIIYELYKVTKQ